MADPKTKPAGKGALYLVDGSGYIFRAYHALPPLTRKRDKLPTGAVLGFCNMLSKLLNDIGPSNHMAVLFDAGRDTFRNEIYPDYKAHRPPPPEDLVPQFALIREATRAFNLASIERDGFEADDLIASYARAARDEGYEVVIVSSDKDLMQLIEPGVSMHDPLKDRAIGEQEVREKFGVGPEKMVDLQALAGDATDNVPGVPGIGVKTAAELINTFGGLDEVLARAEEIKQPKRRQSLIEHADAARISRDLVRLRRDLPLEEGVNDLQIKPPDLSVLVPFLEDLEFGNLLARLRARYGAEGGPPAPAPAPKPAAAALPGGEEAVTIVQTPEDLKRLAAAARMAGAVALHLEGTVADEMRAAVVGIACAYAPGRAWYVPLGHVSAADQGSLELGDAAPDGAPPQIPADAAIALLKPLLEDPGTLKIGHNIKGPVKVLARLGITVAPIEDTMLLSFTLGGGRDKHGAAEIAQRLLEVTAAYRKEALGTGKSAVSFAQLPLETAAALAGEAADLVLRSHAPLRAGLLAEQLVAVYETIERPLVPVLAAMERHGLRVDERALAGLSKDFAGRMADLEVAIHRLAGGEFNVGSPKQLGEILFDQMGLPGGRRAKTGAWTTGADVLEALAADGNELPELVLDWRQLSKLKNTYTDTLGGQIDPETGRVHTTYQMAGAATGRLASFDPNLQNIPSARKRAARFAGLSRPARRPNSFRPIIPKSNYACWPIWPGSAPCATPSPPAPTSMLSPPARCSESRSKAWTPQSGAGPRRSISASSTASRRLAWGANSIFRARRRARTSTPISSAIRAFAITWSRPRFSPASTGTSRPCSGAGSMSPASTTATTPIGRFPSAPRSTRRSRALPPTSSSAPWCACTGPWTAQALRPGCCFRSMTNCCSRCQRTKSPTSLPWPKRSWKVPPTSMCR